MKYNTITNAILFVFIFSFCACSSNDGPTYNNNEPVDHGGVIAYTNQLVQGRIHQINTINEDGTGNQRITESTIGLNHLDWSPDGSQIACIGYYDSRSATWSIHVFNADGTGLTRLTTTHNVWDTELRWSPDGTKFAFASDMHQTDKWEVYVMNIDGSNVNRVTQSPENVTGVNPVWRPVD